MHIEKKALRSVSSQERGAQPCDVCLLAIVTVTYNPDMAVLETQLDQLPYQSLKVLVDNGSTPLLRSRLREIATTTPGMLLVGNAINAGLATALNQGASAAQEHFPGCETLVFLDQDTEPGLGGIEALLAEFNALAATHPRLGCVGPALLDVDTGIEHGFHQISGWRWVRRFPIDGMPIRVSNLNGSGTLVPMWLFNSLGGLAGEIFIDHVDTDWAFRVQDAGYELFGIPRVRFKHRMGETGVRFWFMGWRVWPYRSPTRHFYLFRNTIRLLRAPGVPLVWKVWAPVKLAITMLAHLIFDKARFAQIKYMARGLWSGMRAWDRNAN